MALADRITKAEPKTKFEQWLDSLSPANSDLVHEWLNDPSQSHAAVARAIRDDSPADSFVGYAGNSETIGTWRRKHVAS